MTTFNRRQIFKNAWRTARRLVMTRGETARHWFARSLKEAWALWKNAAAMEALRVAVELRDRARTKARIEADKAEEDRLVREMAHFVNPRLNPNRARGSYHTIQNRTVSGCW